MLAMAILRAPSPASRLLQGLWGVRGLRVDTKPVGARLAGDGDFMGAIARKPAAFYPNGTNRSNASATPNPYAGSALVQLSI